ncbi:hypothetical protein JW711_01095 [Candidatus Woesearchaeota archaeon]|nr:hypothetical protein [Candidatus Woesearchaeota archaeon]
MGKAYGFDVFSLYIDGKRSLTNQPPFERKTEAGNMDAHDLVGAEIAARLREECTGLLEVTLLNGYLGNWTYERPPAFDDVPYLMQGQLTTEGVDLVDLDSVLTFQNGLRTKFERKNLRSDIKGIKINYQQRA